MTPAERQHVETLERRLYLYAQVIDRTTHEFQPVPAAPDWCQRCREIHHHPIHRTLRVLGES